jgi:hypothetical protein
MDIPCLMPNQMEAFNGDTFIELEFLRLKEIFNIETAIETGTCFGSTTQFLAMHFKRVISIEINEQYMQIARKRLDGIQNIDTYVEASEIILDKVLAAERSVTNNTIFFLDAHWGAHCPLQDELRIIAKHRLRPVISIHDFQVPGQPGLGFDCHGEQPFNFEWLKESIENIYGKEGYSHHYNSELESTAIKRGIIYITPREH